MTDVVLVGSYARADEPGVHLCTFDGHGSAGLRPHRSMAGIDRPSYVVAHPRGGYLYAVSELSATVDGAGGRVVAICLEPPAETDALWGRDSGGNWPCHLLLDPSGRWLIVSNYGSGTIAVMHVARDGALGQQTDLVRHEGTGIRSDRQEGPHPHSAVMAPTDGDVIVADLGTDALVTYRLDRVTGTLRHRSAVSTRRGSGPRHMALALRNEHLLVAHELDSTVGVFAPRSSGRLREVQTLSSRPDDAEPGTNTLADLRLAPSGRRLYASNRGDDSIAVYGVDGRGRLERLGVVGSGGACPRSLAIAPDGRHVVVANQLSDEVVALPVLDGPPYLGPPSAHVRVRRPSCVQFLEGAPAQRLLRSSAEHHQWTQPTADG